MKKFYFISLCFLLLFSCQNEENSVIQDNESALTKTSPLSLLVSRVSQNATHCDNTLDDSNCYSVQLPVTLTVNGEQFTVNDEDDFDDVRDNMEDSNSDDDVVHFSFPITIIFRDFQQQVINSQSELDAVDCSSDDDFNEIRCIDFVFPITINTYDTNNQVANTVTIHNNTELYNFIQDIAASDIFTIVYPLTLDLSVGGNITVNSNNELEEAIEDSIDDCDNDTGGSGPTPTELEDIIVDGSWHVSFCEDNGGGGGPTPYNGFVFTFLPDGTVTAVKNSVVSNGTWETYADGSHQKMDLFFTNPQLQGLSNDDWKVTEYNTTNFRLKEEHSGSGGGGGGGGPGGNDYVYFTKN